MVESGSIPVSGNFEQLDLRYDRRHRALWYFLNPRPRPCFNLELLHELRQFQGELMRANTLALEKGDPLPIRYTVLASKVPGIFNLGGDLELFSRLILNKDRQGLQSYATSCIDVLYPNAIAFNQSLTTISLVQGDALAGGFEAAVSSQVVIAERSARFGLPEVLFNLISGMGAYTFLIRRISPQIAERLILGGELVSAPQMRKMGLVDMVVEDGDGEKGVDRFLATHYKRANALSAFEQVRQLVNPITYEELIAVTRIWVDAALKLTARDLRMISALVRAQDRYAAAHSEEKALKGRA